MTATGDRQRGDLLAATGENLMTVDKVLTQLRQRSVVATADLAATREASVCRARVQLTQGGPAAALQALDPLGPEVEAKGWTDGRLEVMLLQAQATATRR